MNTIFKTASISSVILLLTACSAKLVTPTQEDVNRVETKFPGYTLSELNEGKALYTNYCGNCHGLKKPSSESEKEWNHIVPEMVGMINKDQLILNAEEQEKILKYVVTMSTAINKK